ncbi:TetR/AcrR family transcriptional regulator [Flaviflexus salsibiostraticola]|uniref:TetR/AcrR family transcriptional regulator n=1 Tax=Flaviflexus salsibiostraticola TaxID=1282737 RepID=A0A3Q8WSW6_9ACTO|nr:TetR/AcrR family transcriptional regulator [Flaviflexus salsibiostraticola]AZN29311.1 TetR/AcrR family transcriptional regulator [Flaviflexus salsibiostraticola]
MEESERHYHHGDLHNEMIRVGLALIAEGGTKAVGLREVARRVDVSPSAAYRHFDSKADLLEEIRKRVLQDLFAHLEAALNKHQDEPVGDRIAIICRAYFRYAVENPTQFQAAVYEFPISDDRETVSERPLRILKEMAMQIHPPVDDPVQVSLAVWAAAHGPATLSTFGSLREMPLEKKWALLETTIDILLKGLGLSQTTRG